MQEVFEKIIEKLEVEQNKADEKCKDIVKKDGHSLEYEFYNGKSISCMHAIEIVKQEAKKFGTDINVGSNGWIPVEEELPETDKYILLSFSNFSLPCVGRYNENENGGAFYIGDEDKTCVSQDLFVNAWQTLPAPYQSKGE